VSLFEDNSIQHYCDVALPVPLDAEFTYRVNGAGPVVGGRVIVPFREKRLSGIVTRLHDEAPDAKIKTRDVLQVLDAAPVLDEKLIELGRWIAQYYIAPIGEVLRTMLPLSAEFKQAVGYRITERGSEALFESATVGSSRRSQKDAEHQLAEYAVLDYLADGELMREQAIRSATGATREVLRTLSQKKWIAREDLSGVRDARRTVKVAVLKSSPSAAKADESEPVNGAAKAAPLQSIKLNSNQQKIVEALQANAGRRFVEELRELDVPRTTLSTLVKRGIIEILEEAAELPHSGMKPRKLEFMFTAAQKAALRHIATAVASNQFSVSLLHGVTGSGKTAVYLSAMQAILNDGKGAILLVPEIGLTPAVAADLHNIFGDQVAILHSSLSDDERAEHWHRIRRGEARMVVGTRSAIFAPVHDLALIIVEEEHDHSYKQEETPRYHARDVAAVRAKQIGATVVLGSATPSLESYQNALKKKYALIELPDRVEDRPLPEVEIIDMREEFQQTGHEHVLSRKLIEEVTERLERGEQAMILLNRRGYSAFVMCRSCGDTIKCRDCDIAMTHHKRERRLVCHYCGYQQGIPKTCPKCGSEYVQFLGTGSEKLEDIMHAAFPKARIGRMDRDTVRGHDDFERILSSLHAGEIDLLVGTQMIAKGHDIHGVTLVGVVGADTALSLPDFRAAERTFQLLTQVAGRAGRGDSPGKVVLQTYFPDHYAVLFAAQHDYHGFADKELRFRSWMHYPPFNALANVLIRSDKMEDALKYSGIIGKWFETVRHEGIRVLGPAAAPIVRLKRDYRYHFLLKAASREKLNTLLRTMLAHAQQQKIPRTNIIIDVDAISLM
jgi:primosomal protein N' (replication factor Y) (superfamily II helicase)